MPRYYFDLVDDGQLHVDTEGTDLDDTEAARIEATHALAEFARDALPGVLSKHLTMRVRDDREWHFTLDLLLTTLS
jgi:hypothetical protein